MLNTIYHKIPNAWNLQKSNKYDFDSFRSPEIQYLSYKDWIWSEKIDGMNTRVIWDGHRVSFAGRTERSQMRSDVTKLLKNLFGGKEQETRFEEMFNDKPVVLFGETYGGSIQSVGKQYSPIVKFRMFDAFIDGYWVTYSSMKQIAEKLSVETVPLFLVGNVFEATEALKKIDKTMIEGTAPIEGVVGVPAVRLLNNNHNRIITKIKKCFL